MPDATLLPAVVRERLVRFGHPVRVFALLDGAAAEVRRVQKFHRELFLHRLAVAALGGVADDPANGQREAAGRIHFHRYLVVRAAHAPRLHFETRLDVLNRLLEDLERIVLALLFHDLERLVHDAFGRGALAAAHDGADEFRHQRAVVNRVRGNFALGYFSASRHKKTLLLWALRAVLRSALHPARDAHGVQRAAHDVVTHTRQILDAAAPDQHERVLLEVVAHARNVGGDFDAVRQTHAR